MIRLATIFIVMTSVLTLLGCGQAGDPNNSSTQSESFIPHIGMRKSCIVFAGISADMALRHQQGINLKSIKNSLSRPYISNTLRSAYIESFDNIVNDKVYLDHVRMNRAIKQRRRNAFQSCSEDYLDNANYYERVAHSYSIAKSMKNQINVMGQGVAVPEGFFARKNPDITRLVKINEKIINISNKIHMQHVKKANLKERIAYVEGYIKDNENNARRQHDRESKRNVQKIRNIKRTLSELRDRIRYSNKNIARAKSRLNAATSKIEIGSINANIKRQQQAIDQYKRKIKVEKSSIKEMTSRTYSESASTKRARSQLDGLNASLKKVVLDLKTLTDKKRRLLASR